MPWHDNAKSRLSIGDTAENEFEATWSCHCGEEFVHQHGPVPDFRCPKCGQLVDVKSRIHEDAIAISQIPFDKTYPPGLIVAVQEDGLWIGCERKDMEVKSGPHAPAHSERGTWYYWIWLRTFQALDFMLRRDI